MLFSFASEKIYLLVHLKSNEVIAGSLASSDLKFQEFITANSPLGGNEILELKTYVPHETLQLLMGPTEINIPLSYIAKIEVTDLKNTTEFRKDLNKEIYINKPENEHILPFNFANSPIRLGIFFAFSGGPEIWGSANLNPWLYISPIIFQSGIEVGVQLLPSKRLLVGAGIDLNLGGIAYSTNMAFARYELFRFKKSNLQLGYTAGLYNPIFGDYNWYGNFHNASVLLQFKKPWQVTKNFASRISLTASLQYHNLSTINNDQFTSGTYSETFLFPRTSFGILFN